MLLLNEGVVTAWADTPPTCTPTKLSDEDARILLYASPIAWHACCENKSSGEDVRNELMISEPTKEYPSDDFLVAAIVSRKPVSALGNGILGYFIVDKRTGVVTSMSDFEEVKESDFSKIQTWMRNEHCIQKDSSKNHFQSVQVENAPGASSEDRYYFVRDKYIKQFAIIVNPINESLKGKSIGEQERIQRSQPVGRYEYAVLEELEDLITPIIGEVKVAGFSQQGTINLETLVEDIGFGMVDGLKYSQKKFNHELPTLFVTTKSLLANYLQSNPEYPKELSLLAESGKFGSSTNFYSEVFDSDASVTNYMELPIKPAKGQAFARAYIGIFSQDIGPSFPPYQIFVIASRKDKIYLITATAKTKIEQIPQCKKQSDALWKKSEELLSEYRKSKLNDSSLFDKSEKYENQSFLEYQHCFGREAKKQKFFAPLITEVQSIVDRL